MDNVRPPQGTEPTAIVYDLEKVRKRKADAQGRPAGDATSISDGARELARAQAIVEALDGVRTERVEALKQRIESGDYKPDADAIARRILDQGV